ncbi:hypothetical protein [Thalassotalea ganghwensis]
MPVIRLLPLLLMLVISEAVLAKETFEVRMTIYESGKLIASPEVIVTEGKKSDIEISLPGQAPYKCSVAITSTGADKVNAVINFESDEVTINPEFEGITLGQRTEMIINSIKVSLLIH